MSESQSKKRRGRPVNQDARNFNIALYRLVRGECEDVGGVVEQLTMLTGLSNQAIRNRVNDVLYQYPPEEYQPDPSKLTSDERLYFSRRYRNSDDPEVKSWLQSLGTQPRRKPDYAPSFSDN